MPRLLSFIVAIYLIIVGLIGLDAIHHFIRSTESPSPRANFRSGVGIGGGDIRAGATESVEFHGQ